LGPLLGGAFLGFRLFLTAYLGLRALGALFFKRDNLPLLIFSAASVPIALNQWAPPTLLGFAVVGAGLLLASLKDEPVEEEDEEEEDDGTWEIEDDEATENATATPVRERY
jgi:hypothetical protein